MEKTTKEALPDCRARGVRAEGVPGIERLVKNLIRIVCRMRREPQIRIEKQVNLYLFDWSKTEITDLIMDNQGVIQHQQQL